MEKDIGKINKNDTTDIILRVDDFGGRKGLTVREFVTSDRYTGFTKSGVRILSADFPKFKEMINSITEEDMKQEEAPEEKEEQLDPGQTTLGESEDKKPEISGEDETTSANTQEAQIETVKPAEAKEKSQEKKEDLPDY